MVDITKKEAKTCLALGNPREKAIARIFVAYHANRGVRLTAEEVEELVAITHLEHWLSQLVAHIQEEFNNGTG